MLKKTVALFFCFTLGSIAYSQQLTLSQAIQNSIQKIESEIEIGQKVAVLNFIGESPNLSNHIINEIIDNIINDKKLLVVERSRIDAILAERGIQLSGEVSDAQIASIGNFDGAQYVITGSLNFVGSSYRFNLYVIDMNRGVRIASSLIQVRRNDADIAYFLDGAPSPNRRGNIVDWRSRRGYIGGCGGYGNWYDGGFSAFVIGFKAELSVAQYFSIDFDIGFEIAESGFWGFVTPCGNILAHIPFRFESGLDIGILGGIYGGDPEYVGICGGASLGYNIGNGILFLDAFYMHSFLSYDYDDMNTSLSGYIVRVGYKVGIGKR